MIVETAGLGQVEVAPENIYTFPDGILGFEEINAYALIKKTGSPFHWLQAIKERALSFVVMPPKEIKKDYALKIPKSDLKTLQADSLEQLFSYVIITIPQDPKQMTANFQGPLVFNPQTALAKQCISLIDAYTVRHNVLAEMAEGNGDA